MKRLDRQQVIKTIISQQAITTQEELKQHLETKGITVTQATLSRDIREIGLIKVKGATGKRQYSLPNQLFSTLPSAIHDLVISLSRAEFMLVFKTDLGNADILANIIDAEKKADILGTVAGADTLLVICQDKETAIAYETAFHQR